MRQQWRQRKIGGAVPRAWLSMEYPPTCTSSQYTGPLTLPARYRIEKFDWAATPEIEGSYCRPFVPAQAVDEQDVDAIH